MSVHELALALGQTVRQMTTGEPGMSAHELLIEWPTFFAAKAKLEKIQQDLEGTVSPDEFEKQTRTMGGGG